jgi:hypothetical protein
MIMTSTLIPTTMPIIIAVLFEEFVEPLLTPNCVNPLSGAGEELSVGVGLAVDSEIKWRDEAVAKSSLVTKYWMDIEGITYNN